MNPDFQGVYCVPCTPFKEDGSFHLEAAKAHLDWLIENGIKEICLLGATGEYQSVTNEEHKAYVREIASYVKGRLSIIVGVSRERPDDVIDLMNSDEAAGVDGAMILSPFYCHPTQEEILANFQYISSKTSLPMVIYNNPGSAGVNISRETMQDIFKIPGVAAIKESTGDIHRTTEAVLDAPKNISILCGCDSLAMESFVMGAAGWISMAANFAPRDCVSLFHAVQTGDLTGAKEIYRRLLPALNMLEDTGKPGAVIKYILKKYRGLESGHMRRPRLDLTAEEQADIDAVMDFNTIS